MAARLKRFLKLWIDLLNEHELLDHASAISFAVLKALSARSWHDCLGLAVLGAVGQRHVWKESLLPGLKPHVQPARRTRWTWPWRRSSRRTRPA